MKRLVLACCLVLPLFLAAPASAIDAAAADALVRKSKCMTCHHKVKEKDGPPFAETAAKYRDKPEAIDKLTKHVTVPSKVKVDGEEEDHETLRTDDPAAVRNVVEWILSL
ncbi:MAG: class I cytochrome c [Rhodocyclaceae bacterium]|nr:class I cytochrome c [Rhodocyclaceae bacterium]